MNYMLLIHQGAAPTPRSPEDWAKLSEEEQQAVFADYQAINETPGVSPGQQLDEPETATPVRGEDGEPQTVATVRVRPGETLSTHGPFVDTNGALVSCCSFEHDNLDAALEVAA